MDWGSLNKEQAKAIRPHVKGKTVWDLGAGDLTLSYQLLKLGAEKVVAVEKEETHPSRSQAVEVQRKYFEQVLETPEVVFVSWPANRRDVGLLRLVQNARTVIYLGCNTDYTCCGDRSFFTELSQREVLAYVPERRNSLLVVGHTRMIRPPTEQEWIMTQDVTPCVPFGYVRSIWCKEWP